MRDENLRIKLLAYRGAPQIIHNKAMERAKSIFSNLNYQFVEDNPDVLFFLTGGSEHPAIEQVSVGKFYVLIGSQLDNSYASASEVKAYLNDKHIPSLLLDEESSETVSLLQDFNSVKSALQNLSGKRLGLIGEVSDWLISSSISSGLLEQKFGIHLIEIPWSALNHFSGFKASETFLYSFAEVKHFDLTDTARVSQMLSDTITKWCLDAITVECFPLVQNDGVTACLPLARFNNEGFPAGCEGDMTAIVGMMLCKELTGIIPWIANINKVSDESCLFSHCTIAPGLISDLKVKTHFETGKGTAIEGNFKSDTVTVFRFDNKLSKAFIASAKIIGRPKSPSACRTQIEVTFSGNEVKLLKQNPLGNHHLIFPGDCTELLKLSCLMMDIEVLE